MKPEVFDFYSKTNLKSYNLNESMRYELNMLDTLDVFTRKHSENVANLTCRICEYLRLNRNFTVYCTLCAYLHDVGKLFIPAEILQKDGPLTDEEYAVMKTHTTLGHKICMKDPKLQPYANGALYHHEAINGTGYPNGVKGKDIPMEGKIIRVADEFDAIVSKRQYKTHIGISDTLKILIENSNPSKEQKRGDGKISKPILKALFKVVIDDTEYEIYCISNYIDYLEENIERLKQAVVFYEKMQKQKKDDKKQYYLEGVKVLLTEGETVDNFIEILREYEEALKVRKAKVENLVNEVKIIKKLKV